MPNADDAARPLLDRLERDGIEHLWVSYVDYNGRSQGKSLPRARFEGTTRRGITFARANLGHDLTDHSPSDTAFGADSGDFFAVPNRGERIRRARPRGAVPLPNGYLPGQLARSEGTWG